MSNELEIAKRVEQKIRDGEITQLERALFNAWLSHGRLTDLERELISKMQGEAK